MSCFRPKVGWLPRWDLGEGLRPVFRNPVNGGDYRQASFACRECPGCALDNARDWGIRAWHESMMHDENCFVTLTYAPEFLPFRGMLKLDDYVKFVRICVMRTGIENCGFSVLVNMAARIGALIITCVSLICGFVMLCTLEKAGPALRNMSLRNCRRFGVKGAQPSITWWAKLPNTRRVIH